MQYFWHVLSWLWLWFNRRRQVAAQGLVEYGLIILLIAIVAIGAVTLVGGTMQAKYEHIDCSVAAANTEPNPNCRP